MQEADLPGPSPAILKFICDAITDLALFRELQLKTTLVLEGWKTENMINVCPKKGTNLQDSKFDINTLKINRKYMKN